VIRTKHGDRRTLSTALAEQSPRHCVLALVRLGRAAPVDEVVRPFERDRAGAERACQRKHNAWRLGRSVYLPDEEEARRVERGPTGREQLVRKFDTLE
jgi:hypothetical protein